MRRGEVYWVDFNPARGGEIRKRRPAIIVSNDVANGLLNRVQVVPLTTQTNRVYPSEVLVEVNGVIEKAMANQIRTVSKLRLGPLVGTLSQSDMLLVENAIKQQLALSCAIAPSSEPSADRQSPDGRYGRMEIATIEQVDERLRELPPEKLTVVLDFVSYLVERRALSEGMETALLSEAALRREWDTPEEDEAWSHL